MQQRGEKLVLQQNEKHDELQKLEKQIKEIKETHLESL